MMCKNVYLILLQHRNILLNIMCSVIDSNLSMVYIIRWSQQNIKIHSCLYGIPSVSCKKYYSTATKIQSSFLPTTYLLSTLLNVIILLCRQTAFQTFSLMTHPPYPQLLWKKIQKMIRRTFASKMRRTDAMDFVQDIGQMDCSRCVDVETSDHYSYC